MQTLVTFISLFRGTGYDTRFLWGFANMVFKKKIFKKIFFTMSSEPGDNQSPYSDSINEIIAENIGENSSGVQEVPAPAGESEAVSAPAAAETSEAVPAPAGEKDKRIVRLDILFFVLFCLTFPLTAFYFAANDDLSVFVKNLAPETTEEDLHKVFDSCGVIKKITIKTDRNGNPKGFAYVEFESEDAKNLGLNQDGAMVHNKKISVCQKYKNIHGLKPRYNPYKKPVMNPMDMFSQMMLGYNMRGYGRGRGRGGRGRGGRM